MVIVAERFFGSAHLLALCGLVIIFRLHTLASLLRNTNVL